VVGVSESVWEYNRKRALQRDDGQCQDCGAVDRRVHVHHKKPRSKGGSDALRNLITLCPDCHAERHDAMPCDTCGTIMHETEYNKQVTDEDGASLVSICRDCWEIIEEEHESYACSLCKKDLGRSPYAVGGFDGQMHKLCEKCRKMLVFRHQLNGHGYFDLMTPVDFCHWEGGSDE